MIVCLCKNVSDKDIREAVASGAATVAEVGVRCSGAGTDCESCVPMIEALIAGNLPHPARRQGCHGQTPRAPSASSEEEAA